MLYMDLKEDALFNGIMNRPVLSPPREFTLEHADKVEKFTDRFQTLAEEKRFKERVMKLASAFEKYGATQTNLDTFQGLDTEIMECLLSAAKARR